MMKVTVLTEAGHEEAALGFALSYKDRVVPLKEWWTADRYLRISNTMVANAPRNKGHNKFLEHMVIWLDVEASLEWWKQYDTYRIGVSKQSESSMHTLNKREITLADLYLSEDELNHDLVFYPDIGDDGVYNTDVRNEVQMYLDFLNKLPSRMKSKLLPQAYLQRREIVLSYKVIGHIISQRVDHKLPEWNEFIYSVLDQLEYPEMFDSLLSDLKRRANG